MYKAALFILSLFVLISCSKDQAVPETPNTPSAPLSIPKILSGNYYGTLYTSQNISAAPPWQAPSVYHRDSIENCNAYLSFLENNTAIIAAFLDVNNDTISTTEFYTIIDPGTDTTKNPWVLTSSKYPCKLITYSYSKNDSIRISLSYVCSGYSSAITYNFKGKKE